MKEMSEERAFWADRQLVQRPKVGTRCEYGRRKGYHCATKWAEGRVEGKGQITYSSANHIKEFGLYSEYEGKPLRSSESGRLGGSVD